MKIASAAILENGKVFVGKNHASIVHAIFEETHKRVRGKQWFVTEDGKFVTREEAAKIALASKQITHLSFHSKELFSEDLNGIKK